MIKKQTSIYLEYEVWKKYQKNYPHTLSCFMRKCVEIAVKNPDFMKKIYFRNTERE